MHTGIVTASILHPLSLSAAYGGAIFVQEALRPALLACVSGAQARGELLETAETRFHKVYVPAHLAFAATWLLQRRALGKHLLDDRTREIVLLQDVLITGALVSGIAQVIAGTIMKREFPKGVPLPAAGKARKYETFFKVMGPLNTGLLGAALAVAPALAASVCAARRGILAQ